MARAIAVIPLTGRLAGLDITVARASTLEADWSGDDLGDFIDRLADVLIDGTLPVSPTAEGLASLGTLDALALRDQVRAWADQERRRPAEPEPPLRILAERPTQRTKPAERRRGRPAKKAEGVR
jgi:hypothetical protein